ncbi:hypothetical protein [Anaerorhabdus sp.]|uniref:hypothetical protein n=1 Tax=Anaerorhabdus sp. TaxID=1872524 RepID=UPI002B20B33F|nr:hypothetical protein [Anaerorhabdus sp.]MEA4874075.1 hypothetical protein [Anaerorhabdus sp.]
MNQFIEAAQNLSVQLLPIIGVIVLIFLCVLIVKITKLIGTIDNSVKNLDETIKLIDMSIEKVQKPLDTAVKLSHTVDEVHDAGYAAVKQAGEYIAENIVVAKNYFNDKMNKKPTNQEDPFVNEEDNVNF